MSRRRRARAALAGAIGGRARRGGRRGAGRLRRVPVARASRRPRRRRNGAAATAGGQGPEAATPGCRPGGGPPRGLPHRPEPGRPGAGGPALRAPPLGGPGPAGGGPARARAQRALPRRRHHLPELDAEPPGHSRGGRRPPGRGGPRRPPAGAAAGAGARPGAAHHRAPPQRRGGHRRGGSRGGRTAPRTALGRRWRCSASPEPPAWRGGVLLVGGGWDVVVDAESGAVLRSRSLTREATGIIHQNYPGAPVGGADQAVSLDPWLSAGQPAERPEHPRVRGSTGQLRAWRPGPVRGRDPASTAGNWNHAPVRMTGSGQTCPVGGCTWDQGNGLFSWTVNRNQAATQLFWFVNRFHDHLRNAAGIGFGPSSGSFEGSDAVLAQVDDGVHDGRIVPELRAREQRRHDGVPRRLPGEARDLPLDLRLRRNRHQRRERRRRSLRRLPRVHARDVPAPGHRQRRRRSAERRAAGGHGRGLERLVRRGLPGGRRLPERHRRPGELRAGPYLGAADLRTQPFDCPVAPAGGPCPGPPARARAGTPTPISAASSASRRCTPTARSGRRRCGTSGARWWPSTRPTE